MEKHQDSMRFNGIRSRVFIGWLTLNRSNKGFNDIQWAFVGIRMGIYPAKKMFDLSHRQRGRQKISMFTLNSWGSHDYNILQHITTAITSDIT